MLVHTWVASQSNKVKVRSNEVVNLTVLHIEHMNSYDKTILTLTDFPVQKLAIAFLYINHIFGMKARNKLLS